MVSYDLDRKARRLLTALADRDGEATIETLTEATGLTRGQVTYRAHTLGEDAETPLLRKRKGERDPYEALSPRVLTLTDHGATVAGRLDVEEVYVEREDADLDRDAHRVLRAVADRGGEATTTEVEEELGLDTGPVAYRAYLLAERSTPSLLDVDPTEDSRRTRLLAPEYRRTLRLTEAGEEAAATVEVAG